MIDSPVKPEKDGQKTETPILVAITILISMKSGPASGIQPPASRSPETP
jgi:hypothetical protein